MTKVTSLILTAILYTIITNTIYAQDIQRVRIDFETPTGFIRHLLIGFTPDNAAHDGYDYGYDAVNIDNYPDDLNWLVDGVRCVIQGVGTFDNTKKYPLGLYITNPGSFTITLTEMENFDNEIDVFIYDSYEDSYTNLTESNFENNTDDGEFQNRYSIAFKNHLLSNTDINLKDSSIKYLRNSGELFLDTNNIAHITELTVFNALGQIVLYKTQIQTKRFRLDFNPKSNTIYIVKLKTTNGVISKKIII